MRKGKLLSLSFCMCMFYHFFAVFIVVFSRGVGSVGGGVGSIITMTS